MKKFKSLAIISIICRFRFFYEAIFFYLIRFRLKNLIESPAILIITDKSLHT
jgi:hypothetical protein